jgi:hypothetical protein
MGDQHLPSIPSLTPAAVFGGCSFIVVFGLMPVDRCSFERFCFALVEVCGTIVGFSLLLTDCCGFVDFADGMMKRSSKNKLHKFIPACAISSKK